MNIGIIQIAMRFFAMFFIAVSSVFSTATVDETRISVTNADRARSSGVIQKIIPAGIEYRFNNSVPDGIINVLFDGQDGLAYLYDNSDDYKMVRPMRNRVLEIGTGPTGTYTGLLTAYGPDCIGCTGIVACQDRNGRPIDMRRSIYFNDYTFGQLRILAADHLKFPCGTIVELNNPRHGRVLGIVVDTGGDMRQAWRNRGEIHFDLLFESQAATLMETQRNTSFRVKRWGW